MKKAGMAMVLLTMAVFHVFSADDVVFSEGFDTPEAVAKYGPGDGISFVPEGGAGGSGCIRFHRDTVGDSWLLIPIDPAELRGRAIQVEAMMKAEKIAKPSPGYMGPKLMLNLQSPGENSHSEQEKVHGTYDWRKFQVFAQAASDVEKAVLAIGIQHGQGTLYMDDVKITLVPTGETEAFVPPAAPLPTRTKYRGMMSGYDLREADIRDFALDFGGNLLRWQLLRGKADTSTPELYRAWLDAELDKLDLLGGPTIENGTMRYRLSDMLRYLAAGADVVLDEGNTIKPECADVLHSLTDAARQIQVPGYGLVQMHPHSAFTITMNEDYAGTNFMNEATIDRFTPIHIAEPETIVDVLRRVVPEASGASLNICDYVYCAIRDRIRSAGGLEPDAMTIRGFIDALRAEPLLGLRWGLLDNVASKPQDAYTRLQLTELIESMVPQDGRV